MAAGCKKCDPHEICEECPEWIFTLADLIMCMMGLFVIMWVLKPGMQQPPEPQQAAQGKSAEEAWIETVIGIRGGFGWEPDPNSLDPVDQQAMRMKVRNGPGEHGRVDRKTEGADGTDPEVTTIRPGKQATVGSKLIFPPGQDRLSDSAKRALDQVVQQIRGHKNVFVVKGHASRDDLDESATAEEKMSLSVRRAQAAADYLMGKGVSPEILRVQGCSTFEPIAARAYTPEAQAANRRVEVESTDTLVEDVSAQPKSGKVNQ